MIQCRNCFQVIRSVLVPVLLLVTASVLADPPDMPPSRKELHRYRLGPPDADRLLRHFAEMEKRPFDGVVLEVTGRTADGKPCSLRETFSKAKWQREWFRAVWNNFGPARSRDSPPTWSCTG